MYFGLAIKGKVYIALKLFLPQALLINYFSADATTELYYNSLKHIACLEYLKFGQSITILDIPTFRVQKRI
jgi:hypothetical protein